MASNRRRENSYPIPAGFTRCATCGEFTGTTSARNLCWNDGGALDHPAEIRVRCLCEGIPCERCKINKIHRPVSNSYDPKTNSIEHWPYFSGMIPCGECKERKDRLLR